MLSVGLKKNSGACRGSFKMRYKITTAEHFTGLTSTEKHPLCHGSLLNELGSVTFSLPNLFQKAQENNVVGHFGSPLRRKVGHKYLN